MDCIREDIENMGIQNWKKMTKNRANGRIQFLCNILHNDKGSRSGNTGLLKSVEAGGYT